MTNATYTRNRVPYGKKATCPCCLKSHSVTQNAGTMVRHGWKETGRQVGSYGNGYQWGECKGWGMRPLEETDADAQDIILGMVESRDEIASRLAELRSGSVDSIACVTESTTSAMGTLKRAYDVASYNLSHGGNNNSDVSTVKLYDDLKRTIESNHNVEHFGAYFPYRHNYEATLLVRCTINRSADTGTHYCLDMHGRLNAKGVYQYSTEEYQSTIPRGRVITIPSFEDALKARIEELDGMHRNMVQMIDNLRKAIEDHRKNPAPWVVENTIIEQAEAPTVARVKVEDSAVAEFITKAKAENPKVTKTAALRAFRAAGNSCRALRFNAVFASLA